jgi:hypothetical protein
MTVGSIIISGDPVKLPERFLLNLTPASARGHSKARFSNYKPSDHAEGGHWTVSFRVQARENILKELFENGLNRLVEVWGYGLEPDFEGLIDDLVFVLPPDTFRKSLRNMANKVLMRADTDDDEIAERSTAIENTDSQDAFGIFDQILGGGVLTSVGVADQAVQQYVDLRGLPMPEAELGGGGMAGGSREPYVEVFVRGIILTLDRRVYNQTAETDAQSMTSEIGDILTSIGEYVSTQEKDTNTTLIYKEHNIDRRGLDVASSIPRVGDAAFNRWLLLMTGRDCTSVVGRRAILKQAAPVEPPPET